MAEKIVQTAGRDSLGEFAPEFAHFNDDVLFGENWNNRDIDVKTRCMITVASIERVLQIVLEKPDLKVLDVRTQVFRGEPFEER